ncbi:MAG: MMPL family transporter [Xanthobacteraceae bacterium]|jgi:hopanoid biosynthesis associated RND transporter like protein HpnN
MKTITAFVVRAVGFCAQFAWWVVAVSVLSTVLASWYATTHFAMTTDINQLISPHIAWREREAAFEKAFPQFELIVAVIDAPTPELVAEASAALVAKLSQEKDLFHSIDEPKGGSFFAQNGLLFESTADLAPQMAMLTKAQRLVQVLAGDPTLRGTIQVLQFGLLGVQGGDITLDNMTWPMTIAANAIEKVNAGQAASFSWRELVAGHAAKPDERLRFLEIQAALDYSELEPGHKATEAIRQAAADLDIASKYQARLRLTGPVPMADEEFATIKENAALNATVTIAVVLLILWLALRWIRIIFAVFACLVVGLSITAAVGLLMVGTLNLISVYFAVLFVGLGVDFGLQFSVRYRAERHEIDDVRGALLQAARRAGGPLTLAACATAAGFLSFLPTVYKGVSELGLIAGVGMLIAFLTSITLLPALLSLLKPPAEPVQLGYAVLAPVDRFLARHRIAILIVTGLVVASGLPLLFWLRFDFNPINLRSPKAESVATYLELKTDPDSGANDIQVLAPSLAEADRAALKLRALPQVGRVLTLSSFIPDDQQQKLPLIENAAKTLVPALNPAAPSPPPTDAQNVSMLNSTAGLLDKLAGTSTGSGAVAARRLAAAMTALATGAPAIRQRVETVFVQPLHTALDDLRNLFKAKEVTRANIPANLARQWVTADGHARIDVSPSGDPNDNATMIAFARAVQSVAPDATEGPISILEARQAIVFAFIEAGACALISIGILLWITLRRFSDVLLTLVPLLLAGVVTLEICVLVGLPLNFANIIALPLLLGVGVAFKIYYIMAWREGQTNLLQSVLTRAVTFSAMTTATAFGSLWFSSHPGTSSMGKLLAISLITTMAAAALFQPILMGKPREQEPSA